MQAVVAEASSQKLASLQCSGMVWLEMAGEVFGFDQTLPGLNNLFEHDLMLLLK